MKVPPGSLAAIVVSAGVIAAALMAQGNKPADPAPAPAKKATRSVSTEERLDALARAQVWRAPAVPVGNVRFTASASQPESISCRFQITDLGGTAQKFDCTLDNGELIRVKYGRTQEIPSEVAASRLLHALGFGADEVMLVKQVRCDGVGILRARRRGCRQGRGAPGTRRCAASALGVSRALGQQERESAARVPV